MKYDRTSRDSTVWCSEFLKKVGKTVKSRNNKLTIIVIIIMIIRIIIIIIEEKEPSLCYFDGIKNMLHTLLLLLLL